MHLNLKSVFRILLLMALVFGAIQFLPAATIPGASAAAPLPAQAAQPKTQKPTQPARQQAQTPSSGVDTDQGNLPEDQQVDLQLIQMRQQLEREAMDRLRYGRPNEFDEILNNLVPFAVFVVVTGAILWILRVTLEHRRWHKMVKVQTETHTKLLDKFGSSQEMLAYMDSEAGKRFLETPVFDAQNKQAATLPFGRILWSVQVGVIAAALGAGFLYLRGRVTPDADMGFMILGTLVLTLGIGFLVSGGVSYALAKYLGLLSRNDDAMSRPAAHSSGN